MTNASVPDPAPPEIHFAGQAFAPLISGALFWPAQNTLLVADLHLEKLSSFATRGQLLPPYDTGQTLKSMAADLAETGASRVIALGDSFHRDEGVAMLTEADRARLDQLTGRAEWIWLGGNHDPAPHALGGICQRVCAQAGIQFQHEPERLDVPVMAGHLHPAARIRINGRSARGACFVHDEQVMILPAYGAATGSLNILSRPFSGLLDRQKLDVVMVGRDRLYRVGTRHLSRRG